jgi:beta-lactamase superfamily II metal-dependent hydrolase
MKRFLVAVCALGLWAQPSSAETLRIYHIDVEQGAATLFVAPGGRTLLFDSGKNGHGSRIQAVMKQAGVSQIDLFVNSHYHEDHFGGIDDLVDLQVPVLEAYDRGDHQFVPAANKKQATWQGYLRTVGEDAHPLRRGHTLDLDPLMTVTCIGSGGTVIGENPPTTGHEENDMSVSLLITFGGFRYFIGGDTESFTEAKMATRDLVMDVDVYQAHHHGSHSSSSAAFMTDARPTVIVISNGNRVDYAHPRQVTLNTYSHLQTPATVFQTNKYLAGGSLGGGNVPDAFIADPETVDDDGTILMTVDGLSNLYTVTYGTAKHTFNVKAAAPTPTAIGVIIESLVPNPVGADEQREEVTLMNRGTISVSLVGWRLRDRSELDWDLTGTIGAGQSRTFRRNGKDMSLNNAGGRNRAARSVASGTRPLCLSGFDGGNSHQDVALKNAARHALERCTPVSIVDTGS